jgi:hypothetical protein
MSFFSLLKKKFAIGKSRKHKKYSLIFNISGGSVSSAIVDFTEKSGINIVFYNKEKFTFSEKVDSAKHLEQLKKTLAVSVEKMHKFGFTKIKTHRNEKISINKIFYNFSSPWILSETKTIRVKEPRTFRLTDDYIKNLINREIQKDKSQDQIIENKIIQVKANGYILENIKKTLTRELEISIFTSRISANILKSAEEIVGRFFMGRETHCHSNTLACFSVLRDLFPHQDDFVIVNVNEELTEASLIKDGIMVADTSFPIGHNYFIKGLAKENKTDEIIAASTLRLSSIGAQNSLAAHKVEKDLQVYDKDWLTNISTVFSYFTEKLYIAENIFLIADSDIASSLHTCLKEINAKIIILSPRSINTPVKIDDTMFKTTLAFLDKLYKI